MASQMIYYDPITEKDPEGKAKLLRRIKSLTDNLEMWEVRFLDDGLTTTRIVKRKE